MAEAVTVPGSSLGTALSNLLCAEEIVPGQTVSYQTCKTLWAYHPLGMKMTEGPIKKAQSLPREITVNDGPEDDCKEAFDKEWARIESDKVIRNVGTQARVYGIASLALLEKGVDSAEPLKPKKIADAVISFNVFDPLNTAGSLVLNQDPNAFDFQKHEDISVSGQRYHRSRSRVIMHEQPIYIEYTTSAYGFVGRSVFQRALFPMKSFIQTMRADDMVARKAGLLVAMLKAAGNIVDQVMKIGAAIKRRILRVGSTDDVLSIGEEEKIESIDLKNIAEPLTVARKDILENIAAAADMPAKLLNNETFAEGFGEGSEDAKEVAEYIDGIRAWLLPLYEFMDMIVQRRAWNEDFYKGIQEKYPETYGNVAYEVAFYRWSNSFKAIWPSLLREPESELVKVDDVKLKAGIATVQVFLPALDPSNKAVLIQWFSDCVSANKRMFPSPLNFDLEKLENFLIEQKKNQDDAALNDEPGAPPPFSGRDSADSGETYEDVPKRIVAIENYLRKIGRPLALVSRGMR